MKRLVGGVRRVARQLEFCEVIAERAQLVLRDLATGAFVLQSVAQRLQFDGGAAGALFQLSLLRPHGFFREFVLGNEGFQTTDDVGEACGALGDGLLHLVAGFREIGFHLFASGKLCPKLAVGGLNLGVALLELIRATLQFGGHFLPVG